MLGPGYSSLDTVQCWTEPLREEEENRSTGSVTTQTSAELEEKLVVVTVTPTQKEEIQDQISLPGEG